MADPGQRRWERVDHERDGERLRRLAERGRRCRRPPRRRRRRRRRWRAPRPCVPTRSSASPPTGRFRRSAGFNLAGLTTLAYFSVDVDGDGAVEQSGPGWVGYQSQALADLVTRAHGAGDRVVLTASCFEPDAPWTRWPPTPPPAARLGASLVQLVAAKNLDGVNLDFEGKGSKDQAGLDTLVAGGVERDAPAPTPTGR